MRDDKKSKRKEARLSGAAAGLHKSKSHIEIDGCSELLVEGCAGLLEYGDETIRMSLGRQVLVIRGSGLGILNMFGETVSIGGRIASIEFL